MDLFQTLSNSIKGKLPGQGGGGASGGSTSGWGWGSGPTTSPNFSYELSDGSDDKQQLAQQIHALCRALDLVWASIKSGQAATSNDLAKERESLLKELAKSTFASELPQLQRFVRVDVQELIAALNSSSTTAADLQKLCTHTETVFASVKNELLSQLRLDATTGNTANFWETNI
jgi:hypothetical protein